MLKRIAIIFFVLLHISCDQISKDLVRKNVDERAYIELIGDNFILTNVENTGAMLGFGNDFPPLVKAILLKAIPIIVMLMLLFRILQKKQMNIWLIIAFSFVIGGGIGNLIDRIAYDSVTDFFLIDLGGVFKTGIFNMADVSVTTGAFLILFLTLRFKQLEF